MSSSSPVRRPLYRLLIEFDVEYANELLDQEVIFRINRSQRQGHLDETPDIAIYVYQQARENNTQYEYKVMMILLFANLQKPFLDKLLQTEKEEEDRQVIERKVREMFVRFCGSVCLLHCKRSYLVGVSINVWMSCSFHRPSVNLHLITVAVPISQVGLNKSNLVNSLLPNLAISSNSLWIRCDFPTVRKLYRSYLHRVTSIDSYGDESNQPAMS